MEGRNDVVDNDDDLRGCDVVCDREKLEFWTKSDLWVKKRFVIESYPLYYIDEYLDTEICNSLSIYEGILPLLLLMSLLLIIGFIFFYFIIIIVLFFWSFAIMNHIQKE